MKILFIADVPLDNPTSGSEQVLNHQATGLARDGMEVFAITRQSAHPARTIKNIDGICEGSYRASVEDILGSLFSLVKYPFKFYRRFTQDGTFQAAVCHQPFNCFSLLIRGKLQNAPLLYVFHSPSHEEYSLSHEKRTWFANIVHVKTRRLVEKFCLRKAVKIMVLSSYMKQKVMEIHSIPANRIIVNPGGVDLDRFKPPQNRQRLKEEFNFPENKIHLLTVRNLEPRMGLDNLLKCIHILNKHRADIHLILGGEGIEKENLERIVRKYGLVDAVTMTGFISSDLLPQYYGASDFFILPTRSLEGFGLVTPESMACGTPVLGTPVGGTKEILSGFAPQLLFRDSSPEAMAEGVQNAIREYLEQNEIYAELRARCREYAAKYYSWKRHTDQLRSILGEMHMKRSEYLTMSFVPDGSKPR